MQHVFGCLLLRSSLVPDDRAVYTAIVSHCYYAVKPVCLEYQFADVHEAVYAVMNVRNEACMRMCV